MKTEKETVWNLWRCDNWRRWASSVGGVGNDQRDGDKCVFSGCKEDEHKIHFMGTTTDPEVAHRWFRSWYNVAL